MDFNEAYEKILEEDDKKAEQDKARHENAMKNIRRGSLYRSENERKRYDLVKKNEKESKERLRRSNILKILNDLR